MFTSGIVAEIGDIHPFESAPRKLRGRLFSGGADISRVSSRATISAHQDPGLVVHPDGSDRGEAHRVGRIVWPLNAAQQPMACTGVAQADK